MSTLHSLFEGESIRLCCFFWGGDEGDWFSKVLERGWLCPFEGPNTIPGFSLVSSPAEDEPGSFRRRTRLPPQAIDAMQHRRPRKLGVVGLAN